MLLRFETLDLYPIVCCSGVRNKQFEPLPNICIHITNIYKHVLVYKITFPCNLSYSAHHYF